MGKDTAIRARIEGDGTDFKKVLSVAEQDAQAWAGRMRALKKSNDGFGGGGGAVGRGGGNAGFALLELSRGVEDAQYGIKGLVNNIPQLAQALGLGAGLAGVASLAAVAFAQLYSTISNEEAIEDAQKTLDKLNKRLIENAEKVEKEKAQQAARELAEATTRANEKYEAQATAARQAAQLTEQVTASQTALAKARADYVNSDEAQAIIDILQIENEQADKAYEAEQKKLAAQLEANDQRFKEFQRIGAAEKEFHRLNEEEKQLIQEKRILEATYANEREARALRAQKAIEQTSQKQAEADEEERQRAIKRDEQFTREVANKEAAFEREQRQKAVEKELTDSQKAAEAHIADLRRQNRNTQADREQRDLDEALGNEPQRNRGRRGRRIDARSRTTRGSGGLDGGGASRLDDPIFTRPAGSLRRDLDEDFSGVGGNARRKRSPHAQRVHEARIEKAEGGAGAWVNRLGRAVEKFDKAVDQMTDKSKSEPLRRG